MAPETARQGRALAGLLVLGGLAFSGCRREPAPGVQPLLEAVTHGGGRARVSEVAFAGDARPALVEPARYRVRLPARALLTFGLGAPRRGNASPNLRLTVRADGQAVFRQALAAGALGRWNEFSVPFEGTSREVELEFDPRPRAADGRPLGGLAVSEPTLHDLDGYGRAKGVVLISIDTLRRDRVGAYGHVRPTTPRLDALAREGLLCEDAVSTSSWTLPSHLSMFTSADTGVHGGVDAQHGFNRRIPTLAALLRTAGFATRAVTSHLYVAPAYGLDDGFDRFDFVENRKASEVADRALSQLDQVGDRPFFLFLHFYDAHAHYTPPARTQALFPSPYRGPLSGILGHFKGLTRDTVPPGYLEHLLALYDAEIRFVDDQIGRVLDHLSARGLERSTLVVATSDHGEEFLDHGAWDHGRTLHEEIIRIPMILRGPGVRRGREPGQVSLLDVMPTILEWAGLPVPPRAQGRSLLREVERREAFGDKGHAKGGGRKLYLRGGAGRFKLILWLDSVEDRVVREEWYDLAADPGERREVPPPPQQAEALRRKALARWREARGLGGEGAGVNLSPEEVEQLRALGYLGT